MEISERLRLLRIKLEMSQEDFAESIGLKQGSYSDIERGRTKNISGPIIKIIEILYGVNSEWLIKGEGELFIGKSVNISASGEKSAAAIGWAISGNVNLPELKEPSKQKIINKEGIDITQESWPTERSQLLNRIVELEGDVKLLNDKVSSLQNSIFDKERLIEEKERSIQGKDKLIELLINK